MTSTVGLRARGAPAGFKVDCAARVQHNRLGANFELRPYLAERRKADGSKKQPE